MNTFYKFLGERIYPSPTDYEPPNRLTDTFFSHILKTIIYTTLFLVEGIFVVWILAKLFG